MRDHQQQFTAKNARIVVIGMGATETARRFKEEQRLPFTVLVDKKRESYHLLDLRRGSLADVVGPQVWGKGLKAIVRHGQGIPKEDPLQLGGVAVVKNGVVTFVHRSETAADNLPIDDLLAQI